MTKRNRRAELLRAIQAAEDWINRGKLASDTGKSKLSPNDVNWLVSLEREGLIEVRKQSIVSPLGYEWQYRAKGSSR